MHPHIPLTRTACGHAAHLGEIIDSCRFYLDLPGHIDLYDLHDFTRHVAGWESYNPHEPAHVLLG